MRSFLLYGDKQSDHTMVSDVFIDEYMPTANGEYVKVYLFLLRCLKSNTQELSLPLIADKFEHTENDVQRALKYWEKRNLLKLEYDTSKNLTGICLTDGKAEEPSVCCSIQKETKFSSVSTEQSMETSAPAKKCGAAPLSAEEAKQLLFICEQYLGKTLSASEVSKILDFHDTLGFSANLIEYLVEYCVSTRHKSIRYIEAVALSWHEAGYTSVTEARQHTSTYSKAYFTILKAFGISNRNPVAAEINFMNKWMKEYGFSTELIQEACGRTVAAIHQPSFEYADKILCSWKESNVKTMADLTAVDDKRRSSRTKTETAPAKKAGTANRFFNFEQRDYDFKELEKQLINQ